MLEQQQTISFSDYSSLYNLIIPKDNLLKAKQNELQAKYLAILNINMLKFYKEGHI